MGGSTPYEFDWEAITHSTIAYSIGKCLDMQPYASYRVKNLSTRKQNQAQIRGSIKNTSQLTIICFSEQNLLKQTYVQDAQL